MFWKRQKPNQTSFLSTAEIKSHIQVLQLPQTISDFFDGNCRDNRVNRLLGNQYQAPYPLLEIPLDNAIAHYQVDRYIPFLAVWQDVIFAYDHIGKGFVRYGIQSFSEEKLLLMTWDGLWLDEVIAWWELEKQDEDIIYLGNLLGLKNTEMLIGEIAKGNVLSYAEREKWRLSLLQQIDGFVKQAPIQMKSDGQ